MSHAIARFFGVSLIGVFLVMLGYIGGWLWLLSRTNPLDSKLAAWPVWPVACSWQGCVNSKTWLFYQKQASMFALTAEVEELGPAASLTTATRYHLLRQAFVKAPVTLSDAERYRETVLGLREDSKLLTDTGLSAAEYDKTVVLPFLLQEALRQQYRVESVDELYRVLEEDHSLVVLPWRFSWDMQTGSVTEQ